MTRLAKLADVDAHEGPVLLGGALYFTTVRTGHGVSIKRLALDTREVTTVRADANMANGMAVAPDGRLLVCEQGTFETPARIALVDPTTGEAETLTDACDGVPLNSPNDVVVARDGSVWFTDPSYGHLQGFRPEPRAPDSVLRVAGGRTTRVATGFDKPNGLAFSPRGDVLYVSDNGAPHHLLAFEVVGEGLGSRRIVAVGSPEHPDGVKTDAGGRIYTSAPGGVQVWGAAGWLVDEIPLPGAVNFALDGDVLFITTDTAVWTAAL